MGEHDSPPELPLPPLSDDSVIEILDFLYDLLTVFESRYGDQMRRYYDDHSPDNLIEPDQDRPAHDPPF